MALKFKVYPGQWINDDCPLYFDVTVFDCHDYMYKAFRRRPHGRTGLLDFAAIVMPSVTRVYVNGRPRLTPCLGEVFFTKSRCQVGLLAHEASHMAEEYVKRAKFKVCSEEYAYAVGMCVKTMHDHLKKYARTPWKQESKKFIWR